MPDREKVINGLHEMSFRATWKDIDRNRDKFQPIINGAIGLLKEQEAVEPTYEDFFGNRIARCGNCNGYIVRYKYCPGCGRQAKWDD